MPWRCCVPGCKGYDEAKSMGVVFHGLPTRDPPRCRVWLKAIQNPRFDEDTPVSRYSGVRVCSLHFKPEDYEEDFRAKILNIPPKPTLRSGAVPSVFPGRERAEPGCTAAPAPATKRRRTQASSGAAAGSSQPPPLPPPASEESFCIVVSVDPLDGGLHSEPELNSASEESDEDMDKDCAVVYTRSLMELFRRCQTCGLPVDQKQVFHSGAQVSVKWSCHGGHSGVWKSSPRLRDEVQ
ncbi:THAP domain-containing protein 7 [Labrus bergylta]|uniref:THAP domain-containing protein 7 n=1 Tax=Labrus bergylta TaxID=56723 RepID=UPI003313985D